MLNKKAKLEEITGWVQQHIKAGQNQETTSLPTTVLS